MALFYEESDFGAKDVHSPAKPVKEMTEDEYKVYMNMLDKDKGMIKLGYNNSSQTPCKRLVKLSRGEDCLGFPGPYKRALNLPFILLGQVVSFLGF